jgi:hypothetical protein
MFVSAYARHVDRPLTQLMTDVRQVQQRDAVRMALEIFGIIALILTPIALFGAAVKWGVDSRFLDVRSDF